MARWSSSDQIKEARRIYLRCSSRITSPPKGPKGNRDQFPLHTQEAPREAPDSRSHQGNHKTLLPAGHLASHIHGWCGSPNARKHMPVLPQVIGLAEAV